MAVELRCPDCRAKLKLGDAPDPGTEVECPKCGTVFPAPEPEAAADDAPPRKKKKPARDADDADEPREDRDDAPKPKRKDKKAKAAADPKAPRRRKAKKRETSKALLIGVIASGLVALGAVSGLLYYLLGRTPKSVEMMYYVPEDADALQGLNLGHAQKYPELYKGLSGTFANTEFKAAGDALGRALGATDLDGLTDYVLFGSNTKGHSAMVFRSKAEFGADGLAKLSGAKPQTVAGKTVYEVDGFRAGTPRVRVFAPTDRLVVVVPRDVPDAVFAKIVNGHADSKDKTAGLRMGDLGKRVTRGTFWVLLLGDVRPPAASAGAPAGGGSGGDDSKSKLAQLLTEILSGSKGNGYKASIGSREVRFEWIVAMSDSEKASNKNRQANESDLSKGDAAEPPRWWKEQTNQYGNKVRAQLLANIGFGSSGELFYAKSAADTVDIKEVISSIAGKFTGPQQAAPGGPPGAPGGAGMPAPGGPPGRPRRRAWARR